jgi:galactose mutarotase-like enzyme
MDISLAEFGGVPLSWQSPGGDIHPSYYDSAGAGWLRTAAGGLLMTCGLTYVGAPGSDEGRDHGLHGRVHHLPARHVSASGSWNNDNYEMIISGVVEESAIFSENLRLTRTIRSQLGRAQIVIDDVVENLGFDTTPHMILYHFNFGFPLMGEDTTIGFPSKSVKPRESNIPVKDYDRWQKPDPNYQERVYYHEEFSSEDATITIKNPNFPPAIAGKTIAVNIRLSWRTSQLPRLVQWKMPGAGVHVLGIEPANCYVEGRAVERQRGTLVHLEPGESKKYSLRFEVLADE